MSITKKLYLLLICLAFSTSDARAADSCATLLCMAGMLQGQSGGSDCDGDVAGQCGGGCFGDGT